MNDLEFGLWLSEKLAESAKAFVAKADRMAVDALMVADYETPKKFRDWAGQVKQGCMMPCIEVFCGALRIYMVDVDSGNRLLALQYPSPPARAPSSTKEQYDG